MDWHEALNALGVRYPEIMKTNTGGKAFGRRRLHTLAFMLRRDGYVAARVHAHIGEVLGLTETDEKVQHIGNTILQFWPGA